MRLPTAAVSAGSLIGGYAVGRATGQRPLAGVPLAIGGTLCGLQWQREVGPSVTGALLATYVGAFGASHALAKKIGAWPSVLTVSAVTAAAAYVFADRKSR